MLSTLWSHQQLPHSPLWCSAKAKGGEVPPTAIATGSTSPGVESAVWRHCAFATGEVASIGDQSVSGADQWMVRTIVGVSAFWCKASNTRSAWKWSSRRKPPELPHELPHLRLLMRKISYAAVHEAHYLKERDFSVGGGLLHQCLKERCRHQRVHRSPDGKGVRRIARR